MSYQIAPDIVRVRHQNRMTHVELTPAQAKLWGETRAAFLFNCPAFSHILYELMMFGPNKDLCVFTKDIKMEMPNDKGVMETYYPPAATDGAHLIINPDEFFQFPIAQRVFIIAHEIAHCIFDHCGLSLAFRRRGYVGYEDGTMLPYSDQLMNVAEDFVINDMLMESKIGAMPQRDGKQFGLWDQTKGRASDSVIAVYRRLYEENGGKSWQQLLASGQLVSFDAHLEPGASTGSASPDQAAQQRPQQSWKAGVAAAHAIGKMQGDTAGGLDRMFGEVKDPRVSWREHIQSLFARKVGSGGFDWRRPDRQLITRSGNLGDAVYAPVRSGHGADTIVVGVDTSGSIDDHCVDVFLAEVSSILEDLSPKRIIIIWCDAAVNRVDEVEDAGDLNVVRQKGAPGGGGTDFRPVFDEIAKMGLDNIDALVYLSDGYGTFPSHAPTYPTIWGSVTDRPDMYPFGDMVFVDLKS